MPWTKDAVAGMRAQPATVSGAKLYEDTYAALVFDDDDDERHYVPHPTLADVEKSADSIQVIGWVLTTNSPTSFEQRLKEFNFIEGYNEGDAESSFYQRRIANVRLGNPNQAVGWKAVGDEGSIVKAFVYHKPDCNKEDWIDSGDWLQRGNKR
jgi:gamma-glutamylcyclotransferase (GGCT)/AIG2-like uncharacterized protein YtfP